MSSSDVAVLAEPVAFKHSGHIAPNRLVKAPMTELVCEWPKDEAHADNRGKPNAVYLRMYEEWGQGGIGTLIFGNFACDRLHPEAAGNPIIDKTASWDHVEAFRPAITAAKADGAIVLCQISHAGRQTQDYIADCPLSSSNVKCPPLGPKNFNTPRPMTLEEIADVVDRFAFASKVLYDAGAHGIQLHAAHGYLLSQFLSPDVNLRTDTYGGSLENRSRLIFEIIAAIRSKVADSQFLISIKLNSADFTPGGFTAEDSRELACKLEEVGVDLLELSGGTYESLAKSGGFTTELVKESTLKREALFLTFADALRPHLKTTKLCVTGGFRTLAGMASAVRMGSCDLVGIARPLTAEPSFCKEILQGKIDGAKKNLMPIALTTASSNIQIVEIGKGEPISDLSKEEVVAETIKKITGSE
ncbi:FMN-linked oxidoreductase [Meredithblackwellia eburnea MCA 4105]